MTKRTNIIHSLLVNPVTYLLLLCLAGTTVTAQVTAGFIVDTTHGCVPFTVQCTSTQNNNVVNWYWTTSDGQTSTGQNPVFTFTKPGRFRIKLKTSDYSKADSTYRDITANGIPTSFTYQYDNICSLPVVVHFNTYDTVATGNYHWDFGDGTVSIESDPVHTYRSGGAYDIHLVTYSKEGCSDSTIQTFQTGHVTVDFAAPASVCSNTPVSFTSSSSSLPKSASWSVNGTIVSNSVTGFLYSFSAPGTYIIKLSEDFGGCSFFAEKQVKVLQRPIASFTQTGTLLSCLYPSTIQFINTSHNADSYSWNFGDGDTSNNSNPSHDYVIAGQFSPILIAGNANGCTDTLVKPDLILLGPPIISRLQNFPRARCVPDVVKPVAIMVSPEPIQSYDWNFGNGDHSPDSMPAYTYTKQGNFDVTLVVKTVSGCADTFFVKRAESVGDSVVPDFTVDKNILCSSDSFHFHGTASAPAYSWLWYFSDNTIGNYQNMSHRYQVAGYKTVILQVVNNGCSIQTIKKDFVYIKPPVADIAVKYDCNNQLNVSFTDTSQGAKTWLWNFGDGSPVTTVQNPFLHVYSASGIYTVKLSTTNAECASTDTIIVPVLNTKPVFSFTPSDGYLCRKASIAMEATNPEYIADYYWNFDDGRSVFSDTFVTNSYYKAGIYHPSLVAKYKNGCFDTLYSPQPVHVTGPTAAFNTGTIPNCFNSQVVFADKSITDGIHPIISWQWNCGDMHIETYSTSAFSHSYATYGSYKTSLLIKDDNNCADTAYYNVKINALPAISAGRDTFVCDGSNQVQLTASGGVSYVWTTDATLSCINCNTPVASPSQPTAYIVTGTDANQCTNTDTVQVNVIRPFNMTVNPSTGICQTKSTVLQASGADLYTWQPSHGLSNALIADPSASPAETTIYVVTGSDKNHCFSQKEQVTVTVYPNPQFDISDSMIVAQKGDINLLQTTGSDNIVSWQWLPALGLSCTDCPQPYSTAIKSTTYTAVAVTGYGCTDTDKITIHVLCNQSKIYIPTAFTPNGDGKNDWFYVMSNIDNPVQSFVIYNRNGERVFSKTNLQTNNPSQGWDGLQNGQQAAQGSYIYRIEIKCNEELVPFTGTVTVLR